MPLHPQIQAFIDRLAKFDLTPIHELDPVAVREQSAKVGSLSHPPEKVERVQNRMIPGSAGEIPVRIYTPKGTAPFPAILYFHGGGWVLGDLDIGDSVCRTLANVAGSVVVSVDYRLAPESKFPAAVEDAYAAVLWVAENATEIDADCDRIAVVGESAGGNLAAAVSLMARDRGTIKIAYQLLIYPVLNYEFETESYRNFAEGYFLTKAGIIWYWNHYLATPKDGKNKYASPLLAENLEGLPSALIVTAEYDVLRDEAEAYARRLREAGVPVKVIRYEGMIHGFISMGKAIAVGVEALANIATEARNAFENLKTRKP